MLFRSPKGLTTSLQTMFSLKSAFATNKIDESELKMMIEDPIQLALIMNSATDPQTETAIQKFIQSQSLQNLQRNVAYRKMSSIERKHAVLSKARVMALSFGRKYERDRKPMPFEIEFSRKQDKIRKKEAEKVVKEKKRREKIAWDVSRHKVNYTVDDWG